MPSTLAIVAVVFAVLTWSGFQCLCSYSEGLESSFADKSQRILRSMDARFADDPKTVGLRNVTVGETEHTHSDHENQHPLVGVGGFGGCNIIYHVHVPKTGGTSILTRLKAMKNYRFPKHFERQNVYIRRGRSLKSTIVKFLEGELLSASSSEMAGRTHNPIIISAETGITDLFRNGYPMSLFEQTCFVATVREPHLWALSAANHLATVTESHAKIFEEHGLAGFVDKKIVYFDVDNLQSRMTSYSNNEILDDIRPGSLCVYDISRADEFICAVEGNALCEGIGVNNVRTHEKIITEEVEHIVRSTYPKDLELWERLAESRGKLCFSISDSWLAQ